MLVPKDKSFFTLTIVQELMKNARKPDPAERLLLAEAIIYHYPFLKGPENEDGSGRYVSKS